MTDYPSDRVRAALLAARIAATNKDAAREQYKQALAAAHHAGATYAELAAVIGITRQAIRNYLLTN